MAESDNAKDQQYDDEPESGLFRWMSGLVVLLAVAGFFGLAWYAYKSGGEAVDEKDVELVKADKAPIKEVPANPGGMQIPNQDKTVYGLVGNDKSDKAPVERILPAAEEPVARSGGETETWMSDKAKNKTASEATQQVAAASTSAGDNSTQEKPAEQKAEETTPAAPAQKAEQFNPEKVKEAEAPKADKEVASTPAAAAPAPVKKDAPPAEAAPQPSVAKAPAEEAPPAVAAAAPEKKKVEAKKEVAKDTAETAAPKGVRVQLGAYKSDKEANDNWAKISDKLGDDLGNKQHYVMRVNIPDKGTFYRLQLGPFGSEKEAEKYCFSLVSSGQGCIVAHGK